MELSRRWREDLRDWTEAEREVAVLVAEDILARAFAGGLSGGSDAELVALGGLSCLALLLLVYCWCRRDEVD